MCVARPSENDQIHLLLEHLLSVKEAMKKRVTGDDIVLTELVCLAGICHDLAKAHYEWQLYIKGQRNQGPNHAPEGAFLFSLLGYEYLKMKKKWNQYVIYWLWLTRDIADHHGQLKKISNNNWIGAGEWTKTDLKGITLFIHQNYPDLFHIDITETVLEKWTEKVFDVFEEALDTIDLGYNYVPPLELMKRLVLWRELTTALITGDRFHVSNMTTSWLDQEQHLLNDQVLDSFCRKNTSQNLSLVRIKAQSQILQQLEQNPKQIIYTLEMPTGYGKTITALKMANWLGLNQGSRKIIYVAPYLSILEQTSKVIEDSLDTLVLEHHSLAIIEQRSGELSQEEKMKSGQLAMESWANTIICTSFQQWSKALFPERAQDVLRRAYLQDSVVIIDEPQIFDPKVWNVFLCGLEAIADFYNLRIIFLSATMPPFEFGLSQEPVCLSVEPEKKIERYQVIRRQEMDEKGLAQFLLSRKEKSQAAILNTIEDAYRVHKELKNQHRNLKLLHGMMIPLHKRVEITKIQDHLKENKDEPICVISTQIIEAGVDLSFEHIARALPLLPSIIQAAGRVNRNFERRQGILSLVPFLREGKKNTRNSIYDPNLQKLTDELLSEKEIWLESEMLQLIKTYYQKMFEQNSYEASKQAITEAYEGNWPELSKFHPFGDDYVKLPVFVPWRVKEEDEKWLPDKFVKLQNKLSLWLPEDVYERYVDKKYLVSLSFEERKEFMILLNHYIINVPPDLAFSLVGKEVYKQNKIPILLGNDNYDSSSGLAQRYVEGFNNFI